MPSNTLTQSSRSFDQKKILDAGTSLMILVDPSGELESRLLEFLRSEISLHKPKKGLFAEIVLLEDLVMNLHGVTQAKFRDCQCEIPALKQTAKSINNAYTLVSKAYEKKRLSPGGSGFIKVYFQDGDGYWKPLNSLREKIDVTYDSELKQNFRATFNKLRRAEKVDVLSNLLAWATQDNSEQILDSLKRLDANNLQRLNALLGLSHLQNAITVWEENQDNGSEEFWQGFLSENTFIFSQVFSTPVILFQGKAYVGGKGFTNTGGKVVDFLYTNKLTKNTAIVEIKTPKSRILGNMYRDEVYSPSSEISGASVQTSNYKNTLLQKFDSLVNSENRGMEVFNPSCLLIIGNMQRELTSLPQQKSFELFRASQRDVQIITFDELFSKIKILVDLLEGN